MTERRCTTPRARLAAIDLPDFGMPDDHARAARRRSTPTASSASASAMRGRGFDRLVVYADREHSANLSYLTGFDPRFEEAILDRRRRTAIRRSWSATSAGAWPARRRCRCAATCSRT